MSHDEEGMVQVHVWLFDPPDERATVVGAFWSYEAAEAAIAKELDDMPSDYDYCDEIVTVNLRYK